jgi:AraC family transcriptional regulator
VWHRLSHWAEPRDLWTADRLCFGVPHDNPRVTDPAKCRYDAAIAVPESFSANGDVNLVELPGGKFAVARFVGKPWEIGPVYDRLFAEWLPQSGYQPDDRPILERYKGEPYDAVTGDITCDLCAPIRPL